MPNLLIVLGLISLMLIQPAMADSLDFSLAIHAQEADYRGDIFYNCDSNNRVRYNQHFNAAKQEILSVESVGSFDSTNSFAIETNYTAIRMPLTLIGDTSFIENVGTGTARNTTGCSRCVSGIKADADDVTVSSIVSTTPTSLSHSYAVEIVKGRVAVGYRKVNDNVTAESINRVKGKTAVVIGYTGYTFPPAAPGAEGNDIKRQLCPWNGEGVGYPIFSSKGNRTA